MFAGFCCSYMTIFSFGGGLGGLVIYSNTKDASNNEVKNPNNNNNPPSNPPSNPPPDDNGKKNNTTRTPNPTTTPTETPTTPTATKPPPFADGQLKVARLKIGNWNIYTDNENLYFRNAHQPDQRFIIGGAGVNVTVGSAPATDKTPTIHHNYDGQDGSLSVSKVQIGSWEIQADKSNLVFRKSANNCQYTIGWDSYAIEGTLSSASSSTVYHSWDPSSSSSSDLVVIEKDRMLQVGNWILYANADNLYFRNMHEQDKRYILGASVYDVKGSLK
jgi:hypothetical protein